jgi:hypothetical protein
MHFSCAAMWARNSEYKENVFRCPFCYFLLKVPKIATKLIEEKDNGKEKIKLIDDVSSNRTKMIKIHEENIPQIDASCIYCHNIFTGEFAVYKCQKCGSYYHEPCLKKTYDQIQSCRFCGAKIIF